MELLQKHFDIALETPDGIKKLRELILTLAMQGKLVPQDPKDQPANALLKEIESEKKRMVKDGKIRKQEILPPIKKEEIPFEIPKSWEWVRLGQICETNIGLTYSPADISDTGIPVLRSNNVQKGKLDLSNLVRVNKAIKENVLVKEGDLLVCARNGSKALVGKTAQIIGLQEEMAFGAFMAIIRSRFNNYLLYFINSPLFREMIDSVNTMTINQITQNNLKSTIFPLPPLAEQQRIVVKIDSLMILCDQLEKERNSRNEKRIDVHATAINSLIKSKNKAEFEKSWSFINTNFDELYSVPENVTELKKAILQLAVMGKLVPQDPKDQPASELLKEIEAEKKKLFKEGKLRKQDPLPPIKKEEIPYEIPKGWEWVRLGQIAVYNGRVNANPNDIFPDTWVLDLEDIEKDTSKIINRVKYSERQSKSAKSTFCKGDVLYGKLRPYLNKVVVADNDGVCTTEIVPIVPYKGINPVYLKFMLKRPSFIAYVNSLSYGVKMPRLGTSDAIISIHVLPPLVEQNRIVDKIELLMTLCDKMSEKIKYSVEKQTDLFDAVLSKI